MAHQGEPEEIQKSWPTERMEAHIGSLPIWKTASPRLEVLVGGLVNRNWIVYDGEKKYVARVFFNADNMGVSEQSVLASSRAASELGVTPRMLYFEPHLTVVDFIEGRNFTEKELTDETLVKKSMLRLRELHAGTYAVRSPINYHWRYLFNRNLIRWSMENKSPHADEVKKMLPVLDSLEGKFRPFIPCLAHNDLAHVNVMLENNGTVWLIDWDFGAIGHPLTDLSDLVSYAPTYEELDRYALKCYLPEATAPDEFERTLKEYRVSLLLTYMFQYVWAAVADFSVHIAAEDIKHSMETYFSAQEASYRGFMKMAFDRFNVTMQRYGERL
jgi:thiamine kinase-like enzyme